MTIRRPFVHYKNRYLFETGSHNGDGIQDALDAGFEEIHSYEVFPQWHNHCIERFKANPNVHLHFKSSVNMWEEIVQINEPITFWLDGHYSGTNNETGYDPHNFYPLLKELQEIGRHSIKNHTICIDDRRLLIQTNEQTPHSIGFSEEIIINLLKEINSNYTIIYKDGVCPNDVIVAYIKK